MFEHHHLQAISFGTILLDADKVETSGPSFTYGVASRSRHRRCLWPRKDSTPGSSSKDQSDRALIALPNLVGSPEVSHRSGRFLVSAISQSSTHCDREARKQWYRPFYGARGNQAIVHESGNVTLREFVKSDRTMSIEGMGWKVLWKVELHAKASMESS
ncbi:uncharacterized protein EV420DRAFT_1485989 [Desarmillaria tabescens]|uniref:Uncharacterized protein n=1 Tax=Armillaria tabescens TaxID=1929756 RepID=A0AA39JEQ8_ARMTA|nr:uncharacterized protein EV420DRAFT_1485989 [Desarmillaria tabescens]KAK0440426.1 hypothetical protein EV420DRAFT_1485989 [Desarmillaria tabescens]